MYRCVRFSSFDKGYNFVVLCNMAKQEYPYFSHIMAKKTSFIEESCDALEKRWRGFGDKVIIETSMLSGWKVGHWFDIVMSQM